MAVRRLNHAVLYVREISRAVDFYAKFLDLGVVLEVPGRAAFLRARDSANDHDLGLFAVGSGAPGPEEGRAGLYHLAWEIGTLGELVEKEELLRKNGVLGGAGDHGMSLSLYAKDPDGNEFEIMWRTPVEDWPAEIPQKTLPLDLAGALKRWGADRATGAAAGSPT